MRSLLFAALFASTTAAACPNLSGTYAVCRSQSGNGSDTQNMIITQSTSNTITTYVVTSTDSETNEEKTESFMADGRTIFASETDPETGITISLSTTINCSEANELNIQMNLSLNGESTAHLETSISKTGRTLSMVTMGNNMGEEINETVICE